jgi:hypothetical protein
MPAAPTRGIIQPPSRNSFSIDLSGSIYNCTFKV